MQMNAAMSDNTMSAGEFATDEAEMGSQYLTFVCAGEEYGIEILRVQEIKGWEGATHVPHTPVYVLGVMNLRGLIVPVINLRARFNFEPRRFDASTVVIVVRVQCSMAEKTVGVVVDAVSEVYTFSNEAILPPPEIGEGIDGSCVSGLASAGDRMVMLLDIDRLIASSIENI
ncbi:MAG: purine-binding chemotaxis protein CheW [Gammaproteobacteria bacterium]|nr:purine-binding chemotaxis protein CheW [Gammaproteobacteria bacterium]